MEVQDLSFDRRAALDGMATMWPLMIPGIPVGVVLGLAIREEGLPLLAGWSTSWIIFAGASQLAAINLIAQGASSLVIIATVIAINARHIIYSAALRGRFAPYPTWIRATVPYLLIDQQFAAAETAPELVDPTPRYRLWHFLGGGALLWTVWQVAVALGIAIGDFVREEWQLIFSVPILFLGLMVLSLRSKPTVVAAVVAGAVAVFARGLPQGSGLLLAIFLGAAAGVIAEGQR